MSYHTPVLIDEVIAGLDIKHNGTYVDGTVGGAGHSKEILLSLDSKDSLLVCNDVDIEAIYEAKKKLKNYNNVIYVNDNYQNLISNLNEIGIKYVDGILLDLGVSSHQIDDRNRGFSYMAEAPLDMRMSKQNELTAYEVVNEYSYEDLVNIFFKYGEERLAKPIARLIVKRREVSPVESTVELSDIVKEVYISKRIYGGGHPAKKVFQAIRIEVNNELDELFECIKDLVGILKKNGRICIISFHSLEDRIVKQAFVELEKDCICDKMSPICICNKVSEIEILTKKPIVASAKEIKINSRAKSAKLRIARKK